jgi:hypothetical protein
MWCGFPPKYTREESYCLISNILFVQDRQGMVETDFPGRSSDMRKLILATFVFASSISFAQPSPCVVLAANEPSKGIATWSAEGRAQKHMLTYLYGDFPAGIPFRSEIKDKEVDKIKQKGGRVLILDPHYTREDLDKAKQTCAK